MYCNNTLWKYLKIITIFPYTLSDRYVYVREVGIVLTDCELIRLYLFSLCELY